MVWYGLLRMIDEKIPKDLTNSPVTNRYHQLHARTLCSLPPSLDSRADSEVSSMAK
jgi:hypothetical protein